MFGQPQQQVNPANPNNDVEVPQPPDDGISCLAWSCHNHLAVGSWDRSVRVYDVKCQAGASGAQMQVQVTPIVQYMHDAPVLCCNFSKDGTILFSGGCDNKVKMRNLQTQQEQIIGQHAAPVKEVFWCEEMKMVISGSWDKTVKFWSGTSPQPTLSLDTADQRVYSMDLQYPLLVVATANRRLLAYDLAQIANNRNPVRQGETALKMQTRCVSAFPDKSGYAVGSIEGRCSIAYVTETTKNFAFKCHRNNDEIYAVNSISFHPTFGTFATSGSDGVFTFWDKDNRQRLKQFNSVGSPITASGFSPNGQLFAYACSYDWSKGHEHNNPNLQRKVFLHRLEESEIKPKPNQQRAGGVRR
ncbi:unnamed protein product [Amoebophrya sp. A25]|nr:unnamed protein product [Amoebophrya sp. A25]|eukprot:GSA25T00002750001.1